MKKNKFDICLTDGVLNIYTPSLDLFKSDNKRLLKIGDISIKTFISLHLSKLNGQFLILGTLKDGKLLAITDRWSSIHIYFNMKKKHFSFDLDYSSEINEDALFSLFYSRRLFSDNTLYKYFKKINAGQIATIDQNGSLSIKYWISRVFNQKEAVFIDPKKISDRLIELTGKFKDLSLFISGGLDTRTILAAGDKSWKSATTLAFSNDSRELKIAEQLCNLNYVKHNKIILDIKDWSKHINKAILHSKHGYVINSLFLVMPNRDIPHITGIGLDYMFQGMYLNSRMITEDINIENIVRFLPCGNRYISKESDLHKSKPFKNMLEKIRSEILPEDQNSDYIDTMRKILFDDPSMHYSFTDYFSQTARVPSIILSFDRILDDIWQSLDYRQLFNKQLMIEVLKNINIKFCNVISANNNLPLDYNNLDRLILYLKNGISRILTKRKFEHEIRTWPTQGYMAKELLTFFGHEYFIHKSNNFDTSWMRHKTFEEELNWFQARTKENRFARKHCDRENNFLYMLNILLVAS